MKRVVIVLGVLALLADIMLLATGYRLLVYERFVRRGEHYVVQGWGDLASNSQASFACTYWTGRSVKRTVLWYSPNNIMGRDECPLLVPSAE